ncbi:MAG: thioredoxin domain-containing protein [Syntrophobacteraceae bacterium]
MSSQKTRKIDNRQDKLEIPLPDNGKISAPLLLISLVGLLISLMSGFQESIPFLNPLCSSASRNTVEIHFLRMPFWLWGVLFYSVTALLALFRKETATWIAGPAAGVEALLILLMIQLKAPCLFCMANAVVIIVLLVATFRKELFWQQTTLAFIFFVGLFFWVPFENDLSHSAAKSAAVPAADAMDASDSGIAATVGEEVITNQRLDVLLGPKLLETRREIYRMKAEKLDQVITEMILEKEAKQQGKTLDELVAQIAPASSVQVDESEIDKYMQDNQQRLQEYKGNIADLRPRIGTFLEQQKKAQVIRDYVHGLESRYGVRILVPVPNPPKITVDTQGAPTTGPSDAPVTVVEFSDYECPACRSTHAVVKLIKAMYGDKVHWIFKDYPLKRHKEAFKAAEASHCAQEQGKFWEYQESLFTTPDLSPPNMVNNAAQLGMSAEKFSKCLQDERYNALVAKNVQDAVQAGIDRTPSFIINGILFAGGPSLDNFKNMIDEELKKAELQLQPVAKTQ